MVTTWMCGIDDCNKSIHISHESNHQPNDFLYVYHETIMMFVKLLENQFKFKKQKKKCKEIHEVHVKEEQVS